MLNTGLLILANDFAVVPVFMLQPGQSNHGTESGFGTIHHQ